MDDRRHETESHETLEEVMLARKNEMDRGAPFAVPKEDLDEKDRRMHDLNGQVEAYQQRIRELEEENLRLKARVYAQQLLDLTIRVEDTEYIQNPNDVVAHITKAGMIALFRKFVVGKRRSHEDTDDLAAQLSAEALDLVGISGEHHAEMLDVLRKVAKRIFRERDENAIKRRRFEG